MTPPERGTAPVPESSDASGTSGAVTTRAVPARHRRRLGRRDVLAALPLVAMALGATVVMSAVTLAYASWGEALAVAGVGVVALAGALGVAVVRQQAAPWLRIDADGVWLLWGRGRRQGLPWASIAAVGVVGPERAGEDGSRGKPPQVVRAGLARKPFVEVYPVERVSTDLFTPLGCRVVTAQPAAAGLRGRRYIVELPDPAEDIAALDRAVRRFAPDRHLTP